MNTLAAHAALSPDSRMLLFDGKQVELGMWDDIADEFVGPDLNHAIITLKRLQRVMDNRYTWLRAHRRREIRPSDGISVIASTSSTRSPCMPPYWAPKHDQTLFVSLLRDLVARGRAAAMPVIAATQRPSRGHHPQEPARPVRLPRRVPLHLHRQLQHHPRRRPGPKPASAPPTSAPLNPGEGFLIAEGGSPQRIKVAYLTDADIIALADYAAWTRRTAAPPHRRPGHRRRLTTLSPLRKEPS